MKSYQMLKMYSSLMTIVGILIIIGGAIGGIALSQSYGYYGNQFNPVTFGLVFGISVLFGLGSLVTGELIKLLINIEEDLDLLRRNSQVQSGIR